MGITACAQKKEVVGMVVRGVCRSTPDVIQLLAPWLIVGTPLNDELNAERQGIKRHHVHAKVWETQ